MLGTKYDFQSDVSNRRISQMVTIMGFFGSDTSVSIKDNLRINTNQN